MDIEFLGASTADHAGDVFERELQTGGWKRLIVVVAFAKMSGVRYIEQSLRGFVASGGRVDITVGIDVLGTSYEAAWYLMNAVSARGRLLLASAEPGATFHPKVFVFSDASPSDTNPVRALQSASRAMVLVGSSNLTRGGLYVNDEANFIWRPSLGEPADMTAWVSFTYALSSWLDVKGAAIIGPATSARLVRLSSAGRIPLELAAPGFTGTGRASLHGPGSRTGAPASRGPVRRAPAPPPLVGPPPPAVGPRSAPAKSTPGLNVLIARLSFGASRRWPQWELNADVLRDFFGISVPGTPVPREGVNCSGGRLPVMSNPLVVGKGRNRRLEFPDPDGRTDPGRTRLLLVVVDRRPSPFRFAVLFPSDPQYKALDALNQSAVPIGQYVEGTKRVIVPYAALEAVWPRCPL